jgi:hypothetical protein
MLVFQMLVEIIRTSPDSDPFLCFFLCFGFHGRLFGGICLSKILLSPHPKKIIQNREPHKPLNNRSLTGGRHFSNASSLTTVIIEIANFWNVTPFT